MLLAYPPRLFTFVRAHFGLYCAQWLQLRPLRPLCSLFWPFGSHGHADWPKYNKRSRTRARCELSLRQLLPAKVHCFLGTPRRSGTRNGKCELCERSFHPNKQSLCAHKMRTMTNDCEQNGAGDQKRPKTTEMRPKKSQFSRFTQVYVYKGGLWWQFGQHCAQ